MVLPLFDIEIVYAQLMTQKKLQLKVAAGTTVQQAIENSGILSLFPEIDLTQQSVGIYSKKVTLETLVQAYDRIEIYRSLVIDPKEARRKRGK